MQQTILSAEMRDRAGQRGQLSSFRAGGRIPAVIYGLDKAPVNVTVPVPLPLIVALLTGGFFDRIGGSKGMHWTTIGQVAGVAFLVALPTVLPPDTRARLVRLPGVTNLEQNGSEVHFLFGGDINLIIAQLQGRPIRNLLVEEPSLEEIFMHYYN